jgi:hypothetical protein
MLSCSKGGFAGEKPGRTAFKLMSQLLIGFELEGACHYLIFVVYC